MTAKAGLKKRPAAHVESNGNAPKDYRLIPRRDLTPSPTNPRRRFFDESLETLAASIAKQNILEPLIVRESGKTFEIVCGERRWRAAGIVKNDEGDPSPLELIPCLVRELTDEQVLDIQIHENLHREDVHPMDEAYGYQVLKEKLNCDAKELALRVGKSEGYVLNRLKLNTLIEEAQKDIDDGHLPLIYALEIAKYTPDIQETIYSEVYKKQGRYEGDDYVYFPIKGITVSWVSFVEWINTNIHHLLAKAPFSTKATNLRDDELACVKCPDRTGAAASLFAADQIGKKDACLVPSCFKQKALRQVQVKREEIAVKGGIDPMEVPLVRSWAYNDGEHYLGSQSAAVISGSKRGEEKKPCKNLVSAIDIEADNYGKTLQVCLKSTACKIHWPESKVASNGGSVNELSQEDIADASLESKRARREEIWNAKVAEVVRVRVFKEAAEAFEKKFNITNVGVEFFPQLLAKFWRMSSSGDSNNLKGVVKTLLTEWLGESGDFYVSESRSGIDTIKSLKRAFQFRILFLLIHGHKGTLGYNNSYSSQAEVRNLAKEFKVDYALIDAEVRLELSAKKHLETHTAYLEAIQANKKDAAIPRLFSEKWTSRD
ncbi:MAG: ParB/RepB/Spo0J family partition protein [Pyrinomonadaceae bacterium]